MSSSIAEPATGICKAGSPHKLEGPSTVLTFLGIEMDTVAMSLRLPAEKLTELRGLVARWEERSFCTMKELESLAGNLQHACMQGSEAGQNVHEAHVRGDKEGAAFCEVECSL